MKKPEYSLTGEGFTLEEATELYVGYKRPPMTQEEREEYLAHLERFAARLKAEAASNGEVNGTAATGGDPRGQEDREPTHEDQGVTK